MISKSRNQVQNTQLEELVIVQSTWFPEKTTQVKEKIIC